MSKHMIMGTTEEERKKEIYDYAVQCGWNKRRARAYAVVLGNNWLPELEQNYVEWFKTRAGILGNSIAEMKASPIRKNI